MPKTPTKELATMEPAEFAGAANVSRETLGRLKTYLALLTKWQKSRNLVGKATLSDPWRRHFLDSAQLLLRVREVHRGQGGSVKADCVWMDLGSGAGFPGLVLAIMGAGEVHLVESNGKKAAFLRQVIRATGARARVHPCRIEDLEAFPVDYILARALAPIERILELGERFHEKGAEYWLLKGKSADEELTRAGKYWTVKSGFFPSLTDKSGAVLRLWECERVKTP
ncbi:MAG: 16S rRNA (guanine(527)-N(7))-methyltransferase RsmG [Sphingomonadales bacterium]